METTNSLHKEQSPYLQMHAHNPVHWQPWDEKILKQAKTENKLIIVSIGYAACHWCHVMEKESFSDLEVASIMNKHFVSIKVDKEERPDIDQSFMDIAHIVSGRGGWPLNAIALPDGRPIFASTYFRKKDWIQLLTTIQDLFASAPIRLQKQALAIAEGTSKINETFGSAEEEIDIDMLNSYWHLWSQQVDLVWGGQNQEPKFPLPSAIDFLLKFSFETNNPRALEAAETQLTKMAQGGIFDHIGGGFARYSTDKYWHVPHFEKMLYDNVQLLSVYSNAFKRTQKQHYKNIADKTANFMINEMRHPLGGFYSAIDADTPYGEGAYYAWSYAELMETLGKEASLFADVYNCTVQGNWERGMNILWKKESISSICKKHNITEQELQKSIERSEQSLKQNRSKRTAPAIDDKMIASWNALAVSGFVDCFFATGEKQYLSIAVDTAEQLKNRFSKNGIVYRNFKHNGTCKTEGFLDDYAYTIQAYTKIYQATFDEEWLDMAYSLASKMLDIFPNKKPFLFYSSTKDFILDNKIEIYDNVMPSPNAVVADMLGLLGLYFEDKKFIARSQDMTMHAISQLAGKNEYMSRWASNYLQLCTQSQDVTFVGPQAKEMSLEFNKTFHPNILISGFVSRSSIPMNQHKKAEGNNAIFYCQGQTCLPPISSVTELNDSIKGKSTP